MSRDLVGGKKIHLKALLGLFHAFDHRVLFADCSSWLSEGSKGVFRCPDRVEKFGGT